MKPVDVIIHCAILSILVNIGYCGHNLDPHFQKWMAVHLKKEEVDRLTRNDLTTGSFGGGRYSGKIRPVVMVHGMHNEAGSLWKIRADLVAEGFPVQRTFATSWGNGQKTFTLDVKMECKHVQQVRRFIEAVLEYTQAEKINVIGYSMGSPIARKAILGGNCVDDANVNLGGPLTSRIHNYISVAGANQGSQLCFFPAFDVCNFATGLICGSQFLRDINSHKNYESTFRSYNLASMADELVGYHACFTRASSFYGAEEHTLYGKSHTETEFNTSRIQFLMLDAEPGK